MTYARLTEGPETAVSRAMSGRASGISVDTSGSTGRPREVYVGTEAMRASASATHARLGGPGQWLLAVPADRIAGAMVLARSISAGVAPVRMPPVQFTAGVFAATAARLDTGERRYTALVPTQLRRLLAKPVGRAALETFDAVLVGGAPLLDVDVPPNIVTTYGLTESCGGCVYDGRALDHATVEVEDDERIVLAGPMLADGYSDADDAAWFAKDGRRWFRTSDLGAWDDDRLIVLGRADSVIVTGGHKAHPAIVERALVRLPGVADAAVVGIDDPEWGQRVAAIVEAEPDGRVPSLTELRDLLSETLARHELPRSLTVVRSLPRLTGGKIDRRAAALLAD